MKDICILGFGTWAIAISCLLSGKGHRVRAWEYDPQQAERVMRDKTDARLPGITISEDIIITSSIEEAAAGAEVFVIALPSNVVRKTVERFVQYIPEGSIIVNLSKGIEDGSMLMLSQVLQEVAPQCRIAVLSGPSHAEEVSRGVPTVVVAASECEQTALEVQDIFITDSFRVYTNNDVIGVELGGALKNVIALAAGCSDGMGCGDNTKAALMTRGISEITRLGLAMGAKLQTFSGLTGVGDLIVTCTSMHSRNRRAGILMGQGRTLQEALDEVGMVVEGVNCAHAAYELAKRQGVEMPIVLEVNRVLFEGKNPKLAVTDLMTRGRKDEYGLNII